MSPSLIVSCAVFSSYLWEACSFLKRTREGVYQRERGGDIGTGKHGGRGGEGIGCGDIHLYVFLALQMQGDFKF